jgi:hypothetical protein
VTRVARAHIDPARLLTVIVGDRAKLADSLPRLNLGGVTEFTGA